MDSRVVAALMVAALATLAAAQAQTVVPSGLCSRFSTELQHVEGLLAGACQRLPVVCVPIQGFIGFLRQVVFNGVWCPPVSGN